MGCICRTCPATRDLDQRRGVVQLQGDPFEPQARPASAVRFPAAQLLSTPREKRARNVVFAADTVAEFVEVLRRPVEPTIWLWFIACALQPAVVA